MNPTNSHHVSFSATHSAIATESSRTSSEIPRPFESSGPESCKPESCKPESCKPESCKPESCKPESCKPESCKFESCNLGELSERGVSRRKYLGLAAVSAALTFAIAPFCVGAFQRQHHLSEASMDAHLALNKPEAKRQSESLRSELPRSELLGRGEAVESVPIAVEPSAERREALSPMDPQILAGENSNYVARREPTEDGERVRIVVFEPERDIYIHESESDGIQVRVRRYLFGTSTEQVVSAADVEELKEQSSEAYQLYREHIKKACCLGPAVSIFPAEEMNWLSPSGFLTAASSAESKSPPKKSPTSKSPFTKSNASKASLKKDAQKNTGDKKESVEKAVSKKAAEKKTADRKTAGIKVPEKKTPEKKTLQKKAVDKKSVATKATAKPSKEKAAQKTARSESSTSSRSKSSDKSTRTSLGNNSPKTSASKVNDSKPSQPKSNSRSAVVSTKKAKPQNAAQKGANSRKMEKEESTKASAAPKVKSTANDRAQLAGYFSGTDLGVS